MLRFCLLVLAIFCLLHTSFATTPLTAVGQRELVQEELLLQPLSKDAFLAHWQVTFRSSIAQAVKGHYQLFPKALGQLIHKYSVQDLHLTFTAGRWAEKWGLPIVTAPVGAELRVWFNSSFGSSTAQWRGLTHALSGVFCASLNFMDEAHTTYPFASFSRPQTVAKDAASLHYASLPREAVCTENLTPWAKLLPCGTQAGIASLIDPLCLANSMFRSVQTHVTQLCSDEMCRGTVVELVQSLTAVLPLPPADQENGWNLVALLGKSQGPRCSAVTSSHVYVDIQQPLWLPASQPSKTIVVPSFPLRSNYSLAVFEEANPLVRLLVNGNTTFECVTTSDDITVHRYISASSYWGQREKLVVEILNRGAATLVARYIDTLPAFIQPSFHTLSVVPLQGSVGSTKVDWEVTPGESLKPAGLQVHMSLPAGQGVSLSLEWRRTFLHYASYPPDPHRGFHIPSGILLVSLPGGGEQRVCFPNADDAFLASLLCREGTVYRYTEALLLTLQTPDFSMPYNVITLTGAAVGLFFASVFKIAVRRLKDVVHLTKIRSVRKRGLFSRIVRWYRRFQARS